MDKESISSGMSGVRDRIGVLTRRVFPKPLPIGRHVSGGIRSGNIHIANSFSPESALKVLDQIKFRAGHPPLKKEVMHGDCVFPVQPYKLDFSEEEVISQIIGKMGMRLSEIGISSPCDYLPLRHNIMVYCQDTERPVKVWNGFDYEEMLWLRKGLSGRFEENGSVTIFMPENVRLDDPDVRHVVAHEIAHFASPQVYIPPGNNETQEKMIALGFSRTDGASIKGGLLWEEPMVNLVAFYCLDSTEVTNINYSEETATLICMIRRVAQSTGRSPLDVFKYLYRGKTLRDFTVQRVFTEVLGKKAMRRINTTRKPNYYEDYELVPQYGNFLKDYKSIMRSFDLGEAVDLGKLIPGMKGRFIPHCTQLV